MGNDDHKRTAGSDGAAEVQWRKRGSARTADTEVPVGFEMVLFKAADDRAFRARLLSDREAAIKESGVELRPSEWATMRAVPPAALSAMIDRLAPNNPRRRSLMGKVAAAVTSLAAGTAAATVLVACEDTYEGGTAPGTTVDGGSGGVGGGQGGDGAGAAGATGGTGGTAGTGGVGGAAGAAGRGGEPGGGGAGGG